MKATTTALATLLALVACGGSESPPAATGASPPRPSAAPPPVPDVPALPDAGAAPPVAPSLTDLVADRNKTALEALNAHDRRKLASTYAENATINMFGEDDITGRDAIAAEFAQTLMGLPDLKASFSRTWAKNNVEVVEWVITGAGRAGSKLTGLVGLSVLTFAPDGLVTSEHRYRDTPTLLKQLGFAKGEVHAVPVPTATESHVARGTPEEDANLASLTKWYDLINGHKAGAFALLADDATLDDSTADAPTKGRKEIQRAFGRTWKAFPDMVEEPAVSFAVEDFTVSEVAIRGTQKGALGPLKPSKKAMTIHQADIVQWKDGKMVHAWVYGNAKEMFDQLSAGAGAGKK
jgi:ketosteroid isomerase-like protein